MKAGKDGLTRGTFFFARHLGVVAVAWLLWMSWCVLIVVGLCFLHSFLTSNLHGLLQVRGPLASFTSLLVTPPFFAS